jgi:membrane associated rhomboid family serine protease
VILPLGDAPNPRGVPVITYALLAANVAVYALITLPLSVTPVDPGDPALHEYLRVIAHSLPRGLPVKQILVRTSAYDLFVFTHGFRPAAPHLSALFISLFLHSGFLHLFGNMLFLWIFGDNVEHRLGRVAYLLAYLGTGVVATLFYALFDLDSPLPLVGASGAISGVLGFYFRWFPRNQVRLLVLFFPFLMNVYLVPARLVLGMFLIVDNLLPFLITRGMESGGVAYGAHVGGFVAGLIAAWVLDRRELAESPREYRAPASRPAVGPSAAQAVARAVDEGRFGDAAEIYFALDTHATRGLLTPPQSMALADWLQRHGQPDAALTVYRRQLRDDPHGPGAAEAHLGAGLIQLESLGQATPAYQHFLEALELDPPPEVADRAHAALDAIAARQKLQIGRPRTRGWT